jgi:hypothetical protein
MTSRVIVLPSLQGEAVADFAANLAFTLRPQEVHTVGGIDHELPENEWLAQVSLAIARTDKAFQAIHLVAFGKTVSRLPAVAFAQRAARRRVQSYVCINDIPQGQFVDWPDAPVTFVKSNALVLADVTSTAKLRGWHLMETSHDEVHHAVADAINQYAI